MKQLLRSATTLMFATLALELALRVVIAQQPPQPAGRGAVKGTPPPPPAKAKPEELAKVVVDLRSRFILDILPSSREFPRPHTVSVKRACPSSFAPEKPGDDLRTRQ